MTFSVKKILKVSQIPIYDFYIDPTNFFFFLPLTFCQMDSCVKNCGLVCDVLLEFWLVA